MSYILFRTDVDFGRVVAMRFPAEGGMEVGDILHEKLSLSDEAVAYLLSPASRDVPLFCLSDAGLGLLCKTYVAEAGLGVYVHIHTRPGPAVRLLGAGALGSPTGEGFRLSGRVRSFMEPPKRTDTASFAPLLDAWQAVGEGRGGLLSPREATAGFSVFSVFSVDRGRPPCLSLSRIADVIEGMAAFAGCSVSCQIASDACGAQVVIHRPRLLEALLLCLLTEAGTHADRHAAVVELGVAEDTRSRWERRLCLSVSSRVDTLHMPIRVRNRLETAHRYLTEVAARAGLQVQFPRLTPPDLHALGSHKAEDYLFRQTVTLEWLTDPAVLPSSDLKAPIAYETEENQGF